MRTNKTKNSMIYFKETNSRFIVYFIHRVYPNNKWETWGSGTRIWRMNPTPWNNARNSSISRSNEFNWKLKKITEAEAFVELL